jgi:hypothetical protein
LKPCSNSRPNCEKECVWDMGGMFEGGRTKDVDCDGEASSENTLSDVADGLDA